MKNPEKVFPQRWLKMSTPISCRWSQ